MKQYQKIENTDYQLKIEVYYKKENERGYYVSVSPVKVTYENGYTIESYCAYSGYKKLILPVKRQSEKNYQNALIDAPEWIEMMKEKVLNNLKN